MAGGSQHLRLELLSDSFSFSMSSSAASPKIEVVKNLNAAQVGKLAQDFAKALRTNKDYNAAVVDSQIANFVTLIELFLEDPEKLYPCVCMAQGDNLLRKKPQLDSPA